VLSLEEVGEDYNAAGRIAPARGKKADGAVWCRLVRFTLLMPPRIGETSSMRWDHVSLKGEIWSQPDKLTKNGDPHVLPLPPAALAILTEQKAAVERALGRPVERHDPVWLGPGQGKPFNAWAGLLGHLRTERGVKDWSWHDLRRTLVTILAEHGVAESVADGLLNHRQSATRSGVLGVYQCSGRRPERRAALALWAKLVERAAAGKLHDNIVECSAPAAL
jgi:integrase